MKAKIVNVIIVFNFDTILIKYRSAHIAMIKVVHQSNWIAHPQSALRGTLLLVKVNKAAVWRAEGSKKAICLAGLAGLVSAFLNEGVFCSTSSSTSLYSSSEIIQSSSAFEMWLWTYRFN